MDVLSTVANLNTPLQPRSNASERSGMKSQSSDKNHQNSEFSSYMKDSSSKSESKASNTGTISHRNKEQQTSNSSKEDQNNNYNVKSNKESKSSTVNNETKNKKTEKQVETGVTPNAQITDNSDAVKTVSEHINKIEQSKQEYVDPLTRRAAIQAFASKMKSKFGIEPTQIVQSFSNLSVEELGLPPEQTMDKVISQLPLQNNEKQQAQSFFTKMLDKTEASSMSEYLNTSEREYSLKALSDEQVKKEQLDKSLVKLSENFFTQTKPEKISEQVIENNNPAVAKVMQHQNHAKVDWMNQADLNLANNMSASMPEDNKFALDSEAQNFYSQNIENIKNDLSNSSAINKQSLEAMSKNIDIAEKDLKLKKPETQVLDLNKLAVDRQLQTKKVQSKTETSSDLESFSQDTLEPEIDISKSVNTAGAQTQKTQDTQSFQNIIQQQNLTDIDVEQNINKVIQNSQTMIKDGGGEMKIQMNPEGLGEVNLKVLVKDGNVNIEMITENNDAKKLMEKGILDLKSTLAHHKLNVDGIKIDVADQLQNQMDQDFQNQQREFARQFMQDFRQGNQGFRQQFFNGSGPNFKSQTEDEADNNYLRTQSSKKKSNSNRRLDLVA